MLLVKSVAFAAALTGLFYGMGSAPAYAYLDPGTGSMILQLLLGGVAGLALAGRLYWHRFLVMIGVRSEAPEADDRAGDNLKSRADT
jgi:hypothetical protein